MLRIPSFLSYAKSGEHLSCHKAIQYFVSNKYKLVKPEWTSQRESKRSIASPVLSCLQQIAERNRKEFTFTVMWVDFHWYNKNILYFSFKSIPLICWGGFPSEEGTFRTIYQFCPFYWQTVSTGHNLWNWTDWDIEQTDTLGLSTVHRERMQSDIQTCMREKNVDIFSDLSTFQ